MTGELLLVTAPTVLPVTVEEVAQHLKLDVWQPTVLETLIAAAVSYLDGPDGVLNRALMRQTWDLRLDKFPTGDRITIPLPPLVSVTHVKYVDEAGVEQTWTSTEYTVDVPANQVYPAYEKSYPMPRIVPNAVTVRFVAGYTEDALPPADRLLVLWLTAHYHEQREPVVIGQSPASVQEHFSRLINARRLWRVA